MACNACLTELQCADEVNLERHGHDIAAIRQAAIARSLLRGTMLLCLDTLQTGMVTLSFGGSLQ